MHQTTGIPTATPGSTRTPLLAATKPAADTALGLSCLVCDLSIELVDRFVGLGSTFLLVFLRLLLGIGEGRFGISSLRQSASTEKHSALATYSFVEAAASSLR